MSSKRDVGHDVGELTNARAEAEYFSRWFPDPLAWAFSRLALTKTWLITLLALATNGVFIIALGLILSHQFNAHSPELRFLSLSDPRSLYLFLVSSFLIIPTIWTIYTWQPRGLFTAFSRLNENRVLPPLAEANPEDQVKIRRSLSRFHHWSLFLFTFGGTCVGLALWLHAVLGTDDPLRFGEPTVWYLLQTPYTVLFITVIFVNLYMALWVLVRQLLAALTFNVLFRSRGITSRPYHPDGCNGLAPVGDFAIRSSWLIIIVGFWLALISLYPGLFNQPLNLKADTWIALGLYAVVTPSLLLVTLWGTHRTMVEAKNRAKNQIAIAIQRLLIEDSESQVIRRRHLLKELEKRYYLVEREYRTWPFRSLALPRFGFAFLVPLVAPLFSGALQFYLAR